MLHGLLAILSGGFLNRKLFTMKTKIIWLLLIISFKTYAQKCDCAKPPPFPTRKCADSCFLLLINKASIQKLATDLSISDSTAGKIVGGRQFINYSSVYDLQKVLTNQELKELAASAKNLNAQPNE